MELPDDVLATIKEFSRPITRPDWKTYIVISEKRLHAEFEKQLCIRYRRLAMTSGAELYRRDYKQLFNNNHYKLFKYKYCDYIIEL